MAYLLDSDMVIRYLAGDPSTKRLVDSLAPSGIAISLNTDIEVYQGIYLSADPAAAAVHIRAWLQQGVPVLPFT
jgi:predicted nucleic acid-binding protein